MKITAYVFLSICLFAGLSVEKVSAVDSAFNESLMDSTVRIKYERRETGSLITGHGTAFGVDLSHFGFQGKRHLLTAAHNVLDGNDRPYATLSIELTDGSRKYWSPCTVTAFDKQLDICLVEAREELRQVMQLDSIEAGPGVPVVLAGSPRGIPVTLYNGEVLRCFEGGSVRSSAKIEFDHGDSGGPIVNANTKKISGVAVAGFPKDGDLDHTRGMFVPLMAVQSFLQSNQRGNSIASNPVLGIASIRANAERKNEVVVAAAARPIDLNFDEVETVVLHEQRPQPVVPVLKVSVTPPAPAMPVVAPVSLVKTSIPSAHVVVVGDSLSVIARKYGTTTQELMKINEIKNPNLITVGSKIMLPSNP